MEISSITQQIVSYAVIYNFNPKTVLKIAECESSFKNVSVPNKKDGKVWSYDIGPFQINNYFHSKEARLNGLDLHDPEDNISMAFLLMQKNQFKDWSASKKCWSGVS